MLPVVAGAKATHDQMLFYTVLLLPVSLLLVWSDPSLGWCSGVTLLALGAIFLLKVVQLRALGADGGERAVRKAWDVFGFSLIYLALFFVSLVVDSTVI